MIDINADITVGQLATDHPLATRVFERHGIDFCCGGGIALAAVCSKKGIAVGTVLEEIRRELVDTEDPAENWSQAALPDLIEHILKTYHEPLHEELPRLLKMARKVFEVHGEREPQMLTALLETYSALADELEGHMQKEEQILFPMIIAGQGAMADGPVSVMQQEHDTAGEALRRLREICNDYIVPEAACNTWRALWHGLAALERDLHQHIHLENNILFPRALVS